MLASEIEAYAVTRSAALDRAQRFLERFRARGAAVELDLVAGLEPELRGR